MVQEHYLIVWTLLCWVQMNKSHNYVFSLRGAFNVDWPLRNLSRNTTAADVRHVAAILWLNSQLVEFAFHVWNVSTLCVSIYVFLSSLRLCHRLRDSSFVPAEASSVFENHREIPERHQWHVVHTCTGRDTYIQPCSTAHDLFPLKWHKKRRQEGIWKCWLKEVTLYSLSPFISLIYQLQLWFND